ncbi:uncharacterized protein LOC143185427 [Calliopsis andreniformis]|uniref:uncharacterized protein LOC143185427 n=1 Tax=Calliopsis andreniformis TaxID=337506 RepID=UPI003FCDF951
MFPLHLLRFCIFGTSSGAALSIKKEETQQVTRKDEKCAPEKKGKNRDESRTTNSETSNCKSAEKHQRNSQSSSSSTANKQNLKEKAKKDDEESTDEMVTAAEDSDSSVDQWSSACSTMNVSMDYDNINKSMSFTISEEPMDISIEEQISEKSSLTIKSSDGNRLSRNSRPDTSRLCIDDQDYNSSVDEEIARIFQKQCTSSDDELSSSNSKSLPFCKREKYNFLCNGSNSKYFTSASRLKKEPQENERERKKKTSSDIGINNKRRKLVDNVDKDEKRRTETMTCEGKRESRQDSTPNKCKPRTSKTPIKNKATKQKGDVKYKETATQTDSAFSDEDVEMIPIETKFSEKEFCCKYTAQRFQPNFFQGKQLDQDLNYIADNEDSNDGYIGMKYKRISSCSTSSSSTDLGFDERVSVTPDTDVATGRWDSNSLDAINTPRICMRAPPGFPQLPQNPPLTSYACNNSKHFMKSVLKNSCTYSSMTPLTVTVSPAPSPMRHLYYDYPEFMDLPLQTKYSSKILKNNYYR